MDAMGEEILSTKKIVIAKENFKSNKKLLC
jgi:hypothetical protein